MNKAEAIQALQDGKRIAHRTFLPGDYIEAKNGMYQDCEGHLLAPANFWRWRKGIYWDCDWYEYKGQKTNA